MLFFRVCDSECKLFKDLTSADG